MLTDLIGTYGGRLAVAVAGVGLAMLCFLGVLKFIRNRGPSPFLRGGRSREPRLQVLDAAAVDSRRRIVLIRRDDVEHLIMIGGPTDVVIESRITTDGRTASEPARPGRAREDTRPASPLRAEPYRETRLADEEDEEDHGDDTPMPVSAPAVRVTPPPRPAEAIRPVPIEASTGPAAEWRARAAEAIGERSPSSAAPPPAPSAQPVPTRPAPDTTRAEPVAPPPASPSTAPAVRARSAAPRPVETPAAAPPAARAATPQPSMAAEPGAFSRVLESEIAHSLAAAKRGTPADATAAKRPAPAAPPIPKRAPDQSRPITKSADSDPTDIQKQAARIFGDTDD